MSELPEWKKRALADPSVNAKQASCYNGWT